MCEYSTVCQAWSFWMQLVSFCFLLHLSLMNRFPIGQELCEHFLFHTCCLSIWTEDVGDTLSKAQQVGAQ